MKFRYILFGSLMATAFAGCSKVHEGFLSNKLFYRANPFTAVKGRVTTSAPLEADGSSQPLQVKLLAIRSLSGKSVEALTKEYEIAVYKAEVRSTDTTLDQLKTKLGTALYKPFNVNAVGGRLEVTPASAFVDTGTYDFDIEVSNVRSKIVMNNIAKVRITPSVPSSITRQFLSTSTPNQELTFANQPAAAITVTAQRLDGPNRVIIKFVDKNGMVFNPNAGEVLPRVSLPTNLRYHFGQFDPYYPVVKTDTAFVQEYPAKTPTFPLFTLNNAYTCSYRIPDTKNDMNLNLNPEFGVRLYPSDGVPFVSGTWIITNKINIAAKK
ncbi:hypothetical protein V9K67_23815 [Paraflavisolibacter sp. H34]|uniref:hypothetical protein n=1 Tax=Huijunlia imazamoxiresistens TaxID=3127457 RepID=UPI0030189E5F